MDKNYATLSEAEGAFWRYPVRKKNLGKAQVDAIDPDDAFDVDQYLFEFDVKDMVPGQQAQAKKADFIYSAAQET